MTMRTYLFRIRFIMNDRVHEIDYDVEHSSLVGAWIRVSDHEGFEPGVNFQSIQYLGEQK